MCINTYNYVKYAQFKALRIKGKSPKLQQILPADEGNTIVILDRNSYNTKANGLPVAEEWLLNDDSISWVMEIVN